MNAKTWGSKSLSHNVRWIGGRGYLKRWTKRKTRGLRFLVRVIHYCDHRVHLLLNMNTTRDSIYWKTGQWKTLLTEKRDVLRDYQIDFCFMLSHQEPPPNNEGVLFSRFFNVTCKMIYFSTRCFKISKHLEWRKIVTVYFWFLTVEGVPTGSCDLRLLT